MKKGSSKFFYGWAVVFAGVLMNAIGMGFVSMIGIFFPSISSALEISQTQVSMIATFVTGGSLLGGLLAGKILSKFKIRNVIFSFGVMTSILVATIGLANSLTSMYIFAILTGICMFITSFVTVPTLITIWFEEKRGIAMGICMAGVGLSTSLIAPYLNPIITEHGFKSGFMHLSVIMLVITIIASLIIKNNPAEVGLKPYGQNLGDKISKKNNSSFDNSFVQNVDLKTAIKSPSFFLLVIFGVATLFSSIGVVIQIPSYLNYLELPQSTIGMVLAGFGAFITIGKIIIGMIYDKLGLYKTNFLLFSFMIISLLSLYIMPATIGIVTFVLLGGIGFCFNSIANPLIISVLFGPKHYSKIFSVYMLFFSIGAMIATVSSGIIIDKLGFSSLIFIGIALAIIGLISVSLSLTLGTKRQVEATLAKS